MTKTVTLTTISVLAVLYVLSHLWTVPILVYLLGMVWFYHVCFDNSPLTKGEWGMATIALIAWPVIFTTLFFCEPEFRQEIWDDRISPLIYNKHYQLRSPVTFDQYKDETTQEPK